MTRPDKLTPQQAQQFAAMRGETVPIESVALPTTDAEQAAFFRRSRLAHRGEIARIGYIYAIHIPELSAVKIGRTINPLSRIRGYQTGHPRPLRYALLVPTLSPLGDEERLHELFSAHLIQGEWFTDAPSVMDWLRAEHPHQVRDITLLGVHWS